MTYVPDRDHIASLVAEEMARYDAKHGVATTRWRRFRRRRWERLVRRRFSDRAITRHS